MNKFITYQNTLLTQNDVFPLIMTSKITFVRLQFKKPSDSDRIYVFKLRQFDKSSESRRKFKVIIGFKNCINLHLQYTMLYS